MRDLNRRHADAARPALHEERLVRGALAFAEQRTVEHVAPYREEGFRQRRRFDIGQSLRHRQTLRERHRRELRIAAAREQPAYAIAHLEAERIVLCVDRATDDFARYL